MQRRKGKVVPQSPWVALAVSHCEGEGHVFSILMSGFFTNVACRRRRRKTIAKTNGCMHYDVVRPVILSRWSVGIPYKY